MTKQLQDAFPEFSLTSMRAFDNADEAALFTDATDMAGYFFQMRSTRVPGFRLVGNYYLVRGGYDPQRQQRALDNNLFSGNQLSISQLEELERMWVRMHLNAPISVGDDATTGSVDLADAEVFDGYPVGDIEIMPRYRDYPRDGIYRLECNQGRGGLNGWFYFRLDPKTGHWSYLPEFVFESQ